MDGNMKLQGRTESVNGGYLNKIEWVPQCNDFFNNVPNGTVLLGELYFPNQRGSRKVTTILGCLKDKALERQNKGEKLHYYVFDAWAYNGKSLLKTKFEDRVKIIEKFDSTPYVEIAKYKEGEELWTELGSILSNDGEGIVITRRDSFAEPNKRTARKTLKIKMEIEQTIDVFLDGEYKKPTMLYSGKEITAWPYWINEKTGEHSLSNKYSEYQAGGSWTPVTKGFYNNWASAVSISVMKNGKPFHLGYISGISDEMKAGIVKENEKYKGKVFEISAMEVEKIDGNYSLRHGKFVQERKDKTAEDCDFSQIE
jgi:ATP-dependent DNA ligase